ncbi:vacuolar protein sorting-associated protein 51 homolog isoform 3-T3 [Alca torda]
MRPGARGAGGDTGEAGHSRVAGGRRRGHSAGVACGCSRSGAGASCHRPVPAGSLSPGAAGGDPSGVTAMTPRAGGCRGDGDALTEVTLGEGRKCHGGAEVPARWRRWRRRGAGLAVAPRPVPVPAPAAAADGGVLTGRSSGTTARPQPRRRKRLRTPPTSTGPTSTRKFSSLRHHPKDEGRLPAHGGRDGRFGCQHGRHQHLQRPRQCRAAGPAPPRCPTCWDDTLDPKELTECVEMLLQLEEPPEELCEEFLSHAGARLEAELAALEAELPAADPSGTAATPPPASDILDFVDRGSSAFVGNLCLLAASYRSLFEGRPGAGDGRLEAFAATLTTRYFELLERRLALERGLGDTSLLVRALDRFHRRLRALLELLPAAGAEAGAALVARAARERVGRYLRALQTFFLGCLGDVRQALAAPRPPGKEGPGLPDLLATLASSVLGQLKAVLAYVQLFTAKDVAFASLPYFKGEFCVEAVREGLVVAFVRWLCCTARGFADGPAERGAPAAPPALLLLLARLCLDYEATTISYILTLTDEQFPPQDTGPAATPGPALCAEARGAAQRLLDHYVQVQGAAVAQMLRKSVETRDWLGTVEPRNVRAVMKRVVEDITAIDVQVGQLFEEGVRRAQSSDSSRRAFSVYSSSRAPGRYAPSYTPSAPMDTHLLSNIQKLFSERIDIFSPVEFNKVSVLTGIIKISLKTLLECVRLRTLGRFGLQQVQVDGHYLQLYLWRFAADERVVQGLLDEVAASAAHRCLDPVPMEHSVVELICERG